MKNYMDEFYNLSKEKTYAALEADMVKYADLIKVPTNESGELFTTITDSGIKAQYYPNFSEPTFGEEIIVRKTVASKLSQAQEVLNKLSPNSYLRLTFGYRSLATQTLLFENMREKLLQTQTFATELELLEEIHRYIAVPTIAGHPTGGAVDVLVESDTSNAMDFGSLIYDFGSKDCYYASPFISSEAKKNRQLLRQCMTQVGFAPFDGEYWHFSFGDKEWAFYYQQPNALYSQQTVEQVLQSKI